MSIVNGVDQYVYTIGSQWLIKDRVFQITSYTNDYGMVRVVQLDDTRNNPLVSVTQLSPIVTSVSSVAYDPTLGSSYMLDSGQTATNQTLMGIVAPTAAIPTTVSQPAGGFDLSLLGGILPLLLIGMLVMKK